MNNAKIWLVVNPTVGIPLFLGAVAVGSFSVHLAVVRNTTWVADFLSGKSVGGAAVASLDVEGADALVAPASFNVEGGQVVLITMPDGTTARAVLETPQTLASLDAADLPVIEQ
jgi:light-harvesting protein B-800-850 alpha chain